MATFNYTVDTHPMADEMSNVSRQVGVTTGAVVAMQTAVIAAEARAAEHICDNVNKGFYALIRSQISQKLAKLQSEVDSHFMQLNQQKKALLAIKSRMQRDYHMIAGRYIKLFNSLNTNLKHRVFDLDKPTTDFACKDIEKITNRTRLLTATVPLTQLESISASQRIVASNVKQKGLNVINSMQSFIFEMNDQKKLTNQVLIPENNFIKLGTSHIPVVMIESNRDNTDQRGFEIYIPAVGLNNISVSDIRNKVFAEAPQINWKKEANPNQDIYAEFNKLLSKSTTSSRIKDLTMKLFQSGKYQTI